MTDSKLSEAKGSVRSRQQRAALRAIVICLALVFGVVLAPRSFGQLGYGVNTTFDAASGADDATPGDGFCETSPGNNVCTLRAAIQEANAYSAAHGGVTNVIGFSLSTGDPNYNGIFWTINLAAPLPDITSNMTMTGPGSGKLTVKRNSVNAFRIFNVTNTGTTNISAMTMSNGNVTAGGTGGDLSHSGGTLNLTNCVITGGFAKNGGGVLNNTAAIITLTGCTLDSNNAGNRGGSIQNFGTATFKNCTLSNNFTSGSNDAGAIDNFATLNLTNSTLKGNSANGNGGGIYNSGTANISNCTITGNSASASGGGIYSVASTTNLKSSIVALNTAGADPDVSGLFTPQGFNLIGKNDGAPASFPAGNPNANNDIAGTSAAPINPLLDPAGLQNNGGSTLTIALLSNSPAIDKGTSNASTGPLTTDQRGPGYTRAVNNANVANAAGGDGTDVGAFEFGVTVDLISVAHTGNDFVVTFRATSGATYRLERRSDIADPLSPWQSIAGVNDVTPSSTGPASLTHPGGINAAKAFYRVRLL